MVLAVTNPDRFASFSSIERTYTPPEVEEDNNETMDNETTEMENMMVEEANTDGVPDFAELKRKNAEDQQQYSSTPVKDQQGQAAVREALKSIISKTGRNKDTNASSSSSNTTKGDQNDNLASRLEQATVEQEKRDAEARLAAKKKLTDEKNKLKELQKQREAEFQWQETEQIELARKQTEELRMQEEAKKKEKRVRMEALQA